MGSIETWRIAMQILSLSAVIVPQTAIIILFFITWIFPVIYYGVSDKPPFWLPSIISRWSDVARLFSREQRTWAVYEIQALYTDSEIYERLPEHELFKNMPFGYRTRLQRILDLSDYETKEALARWIQKRVVSRSARKIVKIRYIAFEYSSEKHWVNGRKYRQPDDLNILGEHTVLFELAFHESIK